MKKHLFRAVAVGLLVAGGFGVSSALSPASAIDECSNETHDFNPIGTGSPSVGVDDPTTVEQGVVWVCVRFESAAPPLSPVVVGAGAEVRTGPLDIEPEVCVKVDHAPLITGSCFELPSPI